MLCASAFSITSSSRLISARWSPALWRAWATASITNKSGGDGCFQGLRREPVAAFYDRRKTGAHRAPPQLGPHFFLCREIQVLRDSGTVFAKRLCEQAYAVFGFVQILIVQIDVQQVDIPGQLHFIVYVGFNDFPGNGQRRVFRHIVNITIAGLAQLLVFLGKKARKQLGREPVARFYSGLLVVFR